MMAFCKAILEVIAHSAVDCARMRQCSTHSWQQSDAGCGVVGDVRSSLHGGA